MNTLSPATLAERAQRLPAIGVAVAWSALVIAGAAILTSSVAEILLYCTVVWGTVLLVRYAD